jgi:dihydroorotase
MTLLVTGGSVVTPGGVVEADVAIDGASISAIGTGLDIEAEVTIDATGCWVGPGFVDLHTHLREPGQEYKEDIESGRRAAAQGGYTTIYAMPNTEPAIDAGHVARQVARGTPGVVVRPAGAITMGRRGERLAHLDDLWGAGVRLFTDDGDTVADAGLLRRAMEYLAQLETSSGEPAVIAQHAEDPGLCRNGHMHEGSVSSRLGMRGLPAIGEEVIVARDLKLVELTGCRYHVQHVSTAGTIDLVRNAKARGLPVSAEVAPHHLAFDHSEVLTMDPVFKMYPPLRSARDVAALKAALADGTIDAVATDHAPHAAFEKDVPFEEAPRGVIGLETAAAVVHGSVGLDAAAFFDRMADGPRRVLGGSGSGLERGRPADLVVFDPDAHWTVERFASRSANSPWLGRELTGRVVATVAAGRLLYRLQEEAV